MTENNRRYQLLESISDRAIGGYRGLCGRLSILGVLVARELTTGVAVDVPWQRRLWLWRRGFTSRSGVLFDVDGENYRRFVSDLEHERANDVAGRWDAVVNNKLTSYLLFNSFEEHLPALYGVLDDGEVIRSSPLMPVPNWRSAEGGPATGADGDAERADAAAWIDAHLDANEALVLKPIYGHGGKGVFVCRKPADQAGVTVNGTTKGAAEFGAFVDDLEEYGVWEFVEQADYAEALFPDSVNTLRVITMWDYEAGEPFVAGAIHRIGTADSAPVDNWSRGGLSAELREDGTLSSGARWLSGRPSRGTVSWYDAHPDTGERIEGTRVPDWPTVRERILSMAAEFPYLPRIGWDVVVTDDGFVVLEVNSHAGIKTLQVHRPLLDDPRVRRFYDHHDCL